jgi:type I restriction enzyme, S subunit
MKAGWRKMSFSDAVADESGGNEKTPQSEFLPQGRFAVVDQGKELIAGYVDDKSRLCRSELPVIVFGDHTRCFKYVDFPFCMGADGVKVLRPKIEASVKYLYYYFRQLRLTEGGYDRHFKYLKRIDVVLPPLSEQRWIADMLDRAEALRAKRRAALTQLDTLTQSIFLDVFGNPITNPKRWSTVSIGDVAGIIVPTRDKPKRFVGDIPWVTLPDLRGLFVSKSQYALTIQDADEVGNRLIPAHSVLLSCAGTLGRVAVTSTPVYANQQFYGLIPQTDKIDAAFLALCLSLKGEAFFARLGGSFTIGFFSKQKALDIKIPLPPLSIQREFSRRNTAVEKLKSVHCTSQAMLDAMFSCLQHRAFRGEL